MSNIECQFRRYYEEPDPGPYCETVMTHFDRCPGPGRPGEQDCWKAQQELHRREALKEPLGDSPK